MDRLGALVYEPAVSCVQSPADDPRGREQLRDLQVEVLQAIAGAKPLAVVAELLCRRAAAYAPGLVFSLLVADENGQMRAISGPALPLEYFAILAGLVGETELPWVIDLARGDSWTPFGPALIAHGIRACWPYPIHRRGRARSRSRIERAKPARQSGTPALGMVVLHFDQARRPTSDERALAECCVDLAELAIAQDAVRTSLEQSNQRLDVALSSIAQGVCFFDGAQRLILANRRYAELYGLDPEAVRPGTALAEIVALRVAAGAGPAMTAERYLNWRESVQVEAVAAESVIELENGRMISVHHHPMPDGGWVATHEDITARYQAEARVLHMARHDPLTGLANRLLFQERLEHALHMAERSGAVHGLLCLDLDRFKPVNDSLGHPTGDKLLKAVAHRLLGCVRETDTVTRLGGDEFAILTLDIDRPERARDLAQRITDALAETFEIDRSTLSIGASIGIALSPADGTTPEELFGNADIALYRAKEEERGTYRFFEAEMHERVQGRLSLERDLRTAIEQEQFEVFYQPLIAVGTGQVCAFEALLRWRHPVNGTMAPSSFIPLAEETGLIVPLGAWTLNRACREAASWPATITVSVNLSAAQFKCRQLADTVREALTTSGLPPSRLELEITESMLLENGPATLATLHELNGLGVRISMDDFGTGHSSLSYLRSFPFHKIKIDQSFVRDLLDRRDSMAIVRAIVGLGRSLDMVTTAEGVETQAQLDRLREEGCNEVQGFLFSQPRPAADIPLMLGAHRP